MPVCNNKQQTTIGSGYCRNGSASSGLSSGLISDFRDATSAFYLRCTIAILQYRTTTQHVFGGGTICALFFGETMGFLYK